MKKKQFLFLIMFLLVGVMIMGCSDTEETTDPNTDTPAEENTPEPDTGDETGTDAPTTYQQSPMLNDRDLPPVEERLPLEPKVTNEMPADLLDYEIGQYGGTLRTATSDIDQDLEIFVMGNEPLINTPGILGEEFTGNIVKDFEVTDDQQEFTFYLREGLRWSDGELVTMEDFRFAIEDFLFNEELNPIFPNWLRAGGSSEGNPMTFEIIDELTFKLSFDEPYGGFTARLAIQGWRGYVELLKPAHYLKQFHIDYADPEEFAKLLEEEGLEEEEWVNLFTSKDVTNWELATSKAKGFPVLYPWIYVNQTETIAEFERNPYYFKVDSAGNQLPYIDHLRSELVQDVEMVSMKTIAGEVDFLRIATALNKMPLYRENEESGGYRALMAGMHITPSDIFLNLTYDDPVWREVVQDVRFRQALNYAIDREEIIDSIYYGFAEPSQMIDSTFDLDEGNRLLDEMGMTVGSDGFRVGPDGNRFIIPIEVGAQAPDIVPLAELLVEMWKELKLDVNMRTIDAALWGNRRTANELQATIMWTHTPLWYMEDFGQGIWGPLWDRWRVTGGLEGEEPPEEIKEFYRLLDQVNLGSPEEARAAIQQVKEEIGKNLWYFVHIEEVKQPFIVNAQLGNVSEEGMAISTHFAGEQLFFKE